MKQTSKERLNDKARKMIDLIYDEVQYGGEKDISSTFTDKKGVQCTLTVQIKVHDPREVSEEETPKEEIPEDVSNFVEENTEEQP